MQKTIFSQEIKPETENHEKINADAVRESQPKLSAVMDSSDDDVLAQVSRFREHRKHTPSTSPSDGRHREGKHCSDVMGIFPNAEYIIAPVRTLMIATNDELAAARR